MLCITSDLDGTKNITIEGFDQYRPSSWTTRYKIVLSCSLLNWMTMQGRILFSFSNFITTQELSGPFYISPDIYHTQIAEYSLLTFYVWALFSVLCSLFIKDLSNCYYVRLHPFRLDRNWSFIDHLSCALPTETIFDLLESIRSESLIPHYSEEFVFDMLKVIIKWLEVSFKECNRQFETLRTNPICSRELVLTDRATCTIASRVNFKFFVPKKNLRQRGQTGFP